MVMICRTAAVAFIDSRPRWALEFTTEMFHDGNLIREKVYLKC